MKRLFVLFLILSASPVFANPIDTLRVYTWEEALKAGPEKVFAITFEKMKLETLPDELAKFKHLKKLNLSKNKLAEVPDFISKFDSLQELDLHRNKLINFPTQVCSMKNIQRLILSSNEFSSIPECVQYLKKLNYLDLSDSPVTTFPEAFTVMPQLKTLSLHGLAYAPSFQRRWRERLPWMRIEFDAPCDCLE